ncbi:MAG: hypothetical protein WD066_03360 [Planctomycetaceae bacterium]
MLKSSFFAGGLFVALWGVSLLFVEQIVLKESRGPQQRQEGFRGMFAPGDSGGRGAAKDNVIQPPDWAAFSLMSVGAVTMLYAAALPKPKGA